MKKEFLVLGLIFLLIGIVSATNVNVISRVVEGIVVNDAGEPILVEITITNYGPEGNFRIFTPEKLSITPNEINLGEGETKTITLELLPIESMMSAEGYFRIPINVRKEGTGNPYVFYVPIKLLDFKELFVFSPHNINIDSSKLGIDIYNIEDVDYKNIEISFRSVFIDDYSSKYNLLPYEKKFIEVPVNNDKLKNLIFGSYPLTVTYEVEGRKSEFIVWTKLIEQSGVSVNEENSGIIIKKNVVEKKNEGNIITIAEVNIKKNIFSKFFTTFSKEPNRVEREGFAVVYYWQGELRPNESLKIEATTNWTLPFLVILLIIGVAVLSKMYFSHDLEMVKRVNYVRTKSNDFALKVTIKVKAKKFMEKISIYDRIPAMTKVYEDDRNFTGKLDKDKGRLKWDVNYLSAGEERTFSYIIYSKVKILGKFELPSATTVYESKGKVHEEKSNRVFFINEQEPDKD